jgi:hypothetical protein
MDVVHVHVDNSDEFQPVAKTQEVEPEHFVTRTITLPQPSAGVGGGQTNTAVQQVCANDPLRKSVAILIIDSPMILCGTYAQAQDPLNQVASVPNPQGGYIPAGGSAALDGTGPLWICSTVSTPSRVTIIETRRGSA